MKKYTIWLRNGSQYERMSVIAAESSAAAKQTAADLFGRSPVDIIAWASRRDPNRTVNDGTATERSKRLRAKRQQSANVSGSTTISISPALPCAVRGCTSTATVAHAQRVDDEQADMLGLPPGMWLIQPICKECTLKSIKNYEIS